jgi:cytochrome P450
LSTPIQTAPDLVSEVLATLASPAGEADPYPHYARLRAAGPVLVGPGESLVVTGYRACATLLRDHRMQKHPEQLLRRAGYPNWQERPSLRTLYTSILMLNPPAHTRLRRLVSGAFTARRVAELRPALQGIVDDLCERMAGETDFVATVAFPLPVTIIGELLGVPAADRPMFQGLVREWVTVLEALNRPVVDQADSAVITIRDYLTGLADDRRAKPRNDLVTALVHAQDEGDRLDADELVTMVALLLAAGFETTTNLLANGLVALLTHPDQAAALRAEPDLAASAAEELLRYDSPIQALYGRSAEADMSVGDLSLHKGQRVLTFVGAANRDPDIFSDPDRLILDRREEPPLSFGGGIHYCLGAPLARLEAQVAFPTLLRRFPRLELRGGATRRNGLTLHGYASLPVSAR